jgi:hypothetical protein
MCSDFILSLSVDRIEVLKIFIMEQVKILWAPFRLQNFITFGTIAFSFVFDKFYLIMD